MTTLLVSSERHGTEKAGFRRRLPWWVEAVLAVVGYELYAFVQASTDGQRRTALRHGWSLIHLEQRGHVWIEPTINSWLLPHRLLSFAADYYYALSHAFVTAGILVWLWRRHPMSYARWRNILLVLSALALGVFWAYPVAPPRLTSPAVTDLLVHYDPLGVAHAPSGLIDLYAALPSLHVAWAVWCAAAVVLAGRSRWRWLAVIYPLLTSFVVVATANHYVVDVVTGALLTGVVSGGLLTTARVLGRTGSAGTSS